MLVERRRNAFPVEFLARVAIAWALVSAVLIAVNWSAIASWRFPDPDDAMRLVQVRDLIDGQGWFDQTQYRSDAPAGGVPMHWSRLVDIPLVLVILALTPFVGAAGAETAALVFVPLATLGIAMLLAARIAWRLMGDEEATLTSMVMAISIPVLFQFAPLRIDHHGWQIVCALVVVNALMHRSPRVGGWIIGTSCAVWLAISIEGLPLAAAIFGVLALRWFRARKTGDRNAHGWLAGAIQALALSSAALFVLTRGFGDLAAHCDAINPLHLAIFGWGAVVLTLLARLEPLPRGTLLAGFAVAAGGAIGAALYAAPQCATGGFAELDPVVRDYWLAHIAEGLPIWRQEIITALQFAVTPVIGLLAAMNLARGSRDWLRRFWSDYALILAAAFLVSLFVARAGAVACALAAAPLAWQVRDWLRRIRLMKRPAPRVAAMLGVVCALLPAFPAMLLASAIPARAALGGVAANAPPTKASACRVDRSAAVLGDLPTGEIYAPLDIGPPLLLATGHSVVATGHHRGHRGIRVVIETALGPSEAARAALIQRGTRYVALCPGLSEVRMYARQAPEGFAAHLLADDAPAWLEPVEMDDPGGLKVWRIRPE
ncbi:hypothetical protein [Erythrobacter sp. JK5]|uniref:hypothetical protein n=1 Tax=Erythrobacter sp. JK5 TaxID=2829500 RepID=UPI001BACBD2B|nr:hypothetical protein [Erythrobacter sp. JK5]QUL37160.1 hypothetical protein KDC96_12300 [Erythrobacter sp. JK5]